MKIFVSYHSKERVSALLVADYLSGEGYDVWVDRQLTPGSHYRIDTRRHLDEADLVLALWTVGAARSAWVNSEAESAYKRGRLVSIEVGDGRAPRRFAGTIAEKVGVDLGKRDIQKIGRALKLAVAAALGVDRVYRVGEFLPQRAVDIMATLTAMIVSTGTVLFLMIRFGGVSRVTGDGMYFQSGEQILPLTALVIFAMAVFFATLMAPFASIGARILDNLGCRLWGIPVTATLSRLFLRWIGESLGSAAPIALVLWTQDTPTRQAQLEQGWTGVLIFFVGMPLGWALISGFFLLGPKFLTLAIFPSVRRACIA